MRQHRVTRTCVMQTTRDDNAFSFSSETTCIDAASMPVPAPECLRSSYIPQKHSLVSTDTDEMIIRLCNGDIEHFVTMCRESLNRRCALFRADRRVEDANLSVCAACEDLVGQSITGSECKGDHIRIGPSQRCMSPQGLVLVAV